MKKERKRNFFGGKRQSNWFSSPPIWEELCGLSTVELTWRSNKRTILHRIKANLQNEWIVLNNAEFRNLLFWLKRFSLNTHSIKCLDLDLNYGRQEYKLVKWWHWPSPSFGTSQREVRHRTEARRLETQECRPSAVWAAVSAYHQNIDCTSFLEHRLHCCQHRQKCLKTEWFLFEAKDAGEQ